MISRSRKVSRTWAWTSFLKRRITSPLSRKSSGEKSSGSAMAVASSMFIRLAKLRARPSCGVADNMTRASERRASRRARRLRREPVPRSATLWASSITMTSQYACSRYVRYSASCLRVSIEMIALS